jgi:preprotein translocase SecE subunit
MSAQRRAATKQRRTVPPSTPRSSSTKPRDDSAPKTSAKAPVASKPAAQPRQGRFSARFERLKKGAQNTWAEIKKVTWPDSETTRNLTMLVIAMSTVLGLLLGGIDFALLKLFETF